MNTLPVDWERLGEELIESQRIHLLKLGRRIIPTLTPEDMLQPNDYPELNNHPEFRYEEGILAGLLSFQMSLRAECRQAASVALEEAD